MAVAVASDGSEPPGSEIQTASPGAAAWGPLAVEEGRGQGMDAGINGRLSISGDCVFLVAPPATDILLVWPSDRTSWDEDERTITFVNEDGSSMVVRDGMALRLDGGGFSEAEADISTEEWLDQRSWVSAPADRCLLGEAWIVGNVLEAE